MTGGLPTKKIGKEIGKFPLLFCDYGQVMMSESLSQQTTFQKPLLAHSSEIGCNGERG